MCDRSPSLIRGQSRNWLVVLRDDYFESAREAASFCRFHCQGCATVSGSFLLAVGVCLEIIGLQKIRENPLPLDGL
jgi:hypothetical protein